VNELEVYAAIGAEGFTRLVASFYRQIPNDDVLGPMYPMADMAGAEKRLRDFLIYRFGGSETYLQERGHPALRMRHAPFPIDQVARDRWIQVMNRAFDEAGIPAEARKVMSEFFNAMSTFMINQA